MTPAGPAALSTALRRATRELADAGIAHAAGDSRVLAAAATGLSREDMLRRPDAALSREQLAGLTAAVERRRRGEPVSRIIGSREFWGLEFKITQATLDPRPDSEALVEAVLPLLEAEAPRVLDIGTGSGCLLLALLHEVPGATGVGVDVSPTAAAVARTNARRLGMSGRAAFVAGDWAAPLAGRFDVVVSNPPYIRSGRIPSLASEVRCHDPLVSLDGGPDGLGAYRAIAGPAARLLGPGGVAAVEVDPPRSREVGAILAGAGLASIGTRDDLSGRPRVCLFRRP